MTRTMKQREALAAPRPKIKTTRDMMESGEWPVPCRYDDGTEARFHEHNSHCNRCMCAGGGDATPYCWGDDYAEIKASRVEGGP